MNLYQIVKTFFYKAILRSCLIYFFIQAFAFSECFAADVEYLHLNYSLKPVHSPFTSVIVIDKRESDQLLGFVQKGAFNKVTPIKFNGNLCDSLSAFFTSDENGIPYRSLVILFYELFLNEKTGGLSESGRMQLAMRLFSNDETGKFRELYTIDSVINVNAMDVTKKLLNSFSEQLGKIASHISENPVNFLPNAPGYFIDEFTQIDSLEKLRIPIYNTDQFKPGLYVDYDHFKRNEPDTSYITLDTTELNVKVYQWDSKRKKKYRIDYATVYAACDGNTMVKATKVGFYIMNKIGFDFYFRGQTSFSIASNNNSGLAAATLAFGLIGYAIVSGMNKSESIFQYKINYRKGNSIPLLKLQKE